jgi:hypothetical protein
MENFPLHNLGYIEPIVTIQKNHSHGITVASRLSTHPFKYASR